MRIGLLGKKIGMTRVYDERGRATPVTVASVRASVDIRAVGHLPTVAAMIAGGP